MASADEMPEEGCMSLSIIWHGEDALGQEIFLAKVSGMNNFGDKIDQIMCVRTAVCGHSAKAYSQFFGESASAVGFW